MLIIPLFTILIYSYQAFPDGIHTQIIQGKAGQTIDYYTSYLPFILSISFIDPSKANIQTSSPSQKAPVQLGSGRSFYFPEGQTKLIFYFSEDSSIIINYATISNSFCTDGIETIMNSTFYLHLDSSNQPIDKCFMFSYASEQHSFKVVKNSLKTNSSLCLYNDFFGNNAFQCFTEGTAIDDDFRPGGGSRSPWILRYTSRAQEIESSIQIQLKAPLIDETLIEPTSYIGKPLKFSIPEVAQFHRKFWIPIIGSIPSIFLFGSSVATFVLLWRKRSQYDLVD